MSCTRYFILETVRAILYLKQTLLSYISTVFGLTRPWIEPTIYSTIQTRTLTIVGFGSKISPESEDILRSVLNDLICPWLNLFNTLIIRITSNTYHFTLKTCWNVWKQSLFQIKNGTYCLWFHWEIPDDLGQKVDTSVLQCKTLQVINPFKCRAPVILF
jgi:hypothetical protein